MVVVVVVVVLGVSCVECVHTVTSVQQEAYGWMYIQKLKSDAE
jgi:hypothetical protein